MAKANDVQDDAILATLKDEGEQDAPKEPSPQEKPEVKDVEEKKEPAKEPEKSETPPEPAEKEGKEETEAKPKADAEEEPADKTEAEKPAEEDKPQDKVANERKAKLSTEIRDLVAKRNALKTEVEKANAEVYQPAAENELTGETNPDTGQPYTSVEAKLEAMRQQQEMDKYNTQVAEAQLTIDHESERVLQDFPIFNPKSKEYKQNVAEQTAALLRSNLIYDTNTYQVIGSNISPYELYQTVASAHESSTVEGQIKGREDTEQMLANADSPGNVAPIQKKKDPILDILSSDDY